MFDYRSLKTLGEIVQGISGFVVSYVKMDFWGEIENPINIVNDIVLEWLATSMEKTFFIHEEAF